MAVSRAGSRPMFRTADNDSPSKNKTEPQESSPTAARHLFLDLAIASVMIFATASGSSHCGQ